MNLTISAGSSPLTCVLVPIVPDTLSENCRDEVFGINLTAVSPRVTIASGSAIIEIVEDHVCSSGCQSNPCRNGGTCDINNDGSFRCNCVVGYTGETCQGKLVCTQLSLIELNHRDHGAFLLTFLYILLSAT